MLVRIVKWISLTIVGLILELVIAAAVLIVPDMIAFNKVDITDILVREGRYDPAEHFSFDRACTRSVGGRGSELYSSGYMQLDRTELPDPDVYWPLELINDRDKTYRILYGFGPTVEAPGLVCNSKITLRTEKVDGQLRAYVEEARGH